MKKDWSNYSFVVLLPLFFVVIVYTTEAFVRNSFFTCNNGACNESIPANISKVLSFDADVPTSSSPRLIENDNERKAVALRYSGRMTWFFLAEIFLYVCIGSLTVASALAFQLFPQPRFLWMLGEIVLSVMVGFFLYANPKFHMTIFLAIFEKAITDDVPKIAQITNFLNSLGNVAVFSLLLTTCAVLLRTYDDSLPAGMKELSKRMKYLHTILYTGTFLLVTAMLLKKSIYHWSLAYIPQDGAIDIARDFVASLLTLDGGFYTLVLAAAYIPAALVLQRRAQLLVDPSVEEKEKEKKLQENGMTFSFWESLPRILAILGPFLAGPVGDLLTGKFF